MQLVYKLVKLSCSQEVSPQPPAYKIAYALNARQRLEASPVEFGFT